MARDAARVMGLEVAGVDFLRTDQGPLVLEVNASPGLEGIETTSKVNVAKKIVTYLEDHVTALRQYRTTIKTIRSQGF